MFEPLESDGDKTISPLTSAVGRRSMGLTSRWKSIQYDYKMNGAVDLLHPQFSLSIIEPLVDVEYLCEVQIAAPRVH